MIFCRIFCVTAQFLTHLKKEEVIDSTRLYFLLCLSPHNSSTYGPILKTFFFIRKGAMVVPSYTASTLAQYLPVLVNNKDYCHLIIIILCTYANISSAYCVNIYKTILTQRVKNKNKILKLKLTSKK